MSLNSAVWTIIVRTRVYCTPINIVSCSSLKYGKPVKVCQWFLNSTKGGKRLQKCKAILLNLNINFILLNVIIKNNLGLVFVLGLG